MFQLFNIIMIKYVGTILMIIFVYTIIFEGYLTIHINYSNYILDKKRYIIDDRHDEPAPGTLASHA